MNAGKSLDLLKVAYNYKEKNQNPVLLTSAIDDRYGIGKITSRVGVQEEATPISKEDNVFEIIKLLNKEKRIDCILMDEGHFLSKKQIWQLTDIVDKLNIPVIAYGLRADFLGELFEGSKYLFAFADKIEEIKTVCHCGKKATFNMRISEDGKPVYEGEQIEIGGNDKYVAVCRKDYKKGRVK